MKLKHQTHSSLLFQFRALATLLTMGSLSSFAVAQSGTWSGTTTPLTWSDTGNWASGTVATGSGNTANFTNDIAADTTINITADQTIGSIIFGDSNTSTAGSWIIANNAVSTNNLIFAGANPTITVNALGATKTATISAIIQGTEGLTKSGSGTLVLSVANTFTGGFTINDGRVNFASVGGLGANNVTIGGSNDTILDYTGGNASITSVTGWTLTGSGTVTRSNSAGSGIGWGSAKITGSSGGLIYTASLGAVIQLSAVTSDYTGGTTLTSGAIVMNGTDNADTSTAGTFGNGSVASNVLTLNGASIRNGSSVTARTIYNNVSFDVNTTHASGAAAGTLTWAGEVTLNGTGARQLTQASSTQDWVFLNVIKNGTVSDFTVNFTGSRSVRLGAANTFNGTMLVTGTGGGGLALAHVNALQNATLDTGSATASRAVTFTAAGTNTYNIGALQGADDLAIVANTLSVGAKAVDTTFSGAISGTGGLTKSGSGKLTLTANNPYTGVTNISGGTLALTGTASVASSSSLRIAANTTLDVTGVTGSSYTLATTQSISGTGTIVATGKTFVAAGTLTPGNSPGTLVQDGGAMQLAANGNFNWEIADALGAAGTGYDSVSLIGGAVLDLSQLSDTNRYNINLITLSGVNPDVSGNVTNFNNTQNYTWTLFSTGTAIAGFNSNLFTINATGFTNDINGGTFSVALADSNTDLILRFTAIPEPSAALLGGLGALGLLRRRRK
jgi:autotransporter-associated beta strand protein